MNSALTLTSPAFANQGTIPAKYTCDGNRELSPPLIISGVPEGAKSLALVMDDPDIPAIVRESRGISAFDHWVLYNIPVDTTEIPEGMAAGTPGMNSAGVAAYAGPCPPPEHEPKEHRYIFVLYALSGTLGFVAHPTKAELLSAIAPMTMARAELVGRYARR
ncbi:MAG: YbhB/YbcL family Raf kinase inhibitor-like protein [Patescibacteria group bacterium]|nr:YbhB/YbcL family Raf kinase inhibitor-like protein [Patescibacteria group bacterium]